MDDLRKARILKQWAFTEEAFGAGEITRAEASALRALLQTSVAPPKADPPRAEKPGGQGPATKIGGLEPAALPAEKGFRGWEDLEEAALGCRLCRLCEGRKTVVFGEGNRGAALMFIGEAPGFDEDRQGRPFVGKAGQLLTKIIEAMGLKRDDVYIANCLKCRPPENRNPFPDEIALCRPYLDQQIELIKPKVICALGKFAAHTLLGTDVPITRLRGVFQDYKGIKVMPTFHPAYLLRNPADKRLVWDDVQKIMAELGLKKQG